ncbi:hypothetical protein OIU78_025907 [Salix suchowensis]|nr:hypothetical protein OIU78_025907 [Salix suchowensis]
MVIGGNSFKTPFTYCFDMKMPGISMLIGCNFIRAMEGGLRIEGNEVTFYKNIMKIQTTLEPKKIAMLQEVQIESDEFWDLQDYPYQVQTGDPKQQAKFFSIYGPLLEDLKAQGYIGEESLRHWAKNKIICKIDVRDLDTTIEFRPLKHVTPYMKDKFAKHVKALLDLGVIRANKSRHRTTAIIVQSGTTIDPKTGKEVRGKKRMVFDYRALNDNTHKDQDNGLVLPPTKMKIATTEIDFLGATIGNRRIRLQPHIVKKIADVSEDELENDKRVGVHGDKRWKDSDRKLVGRVKELIRSLPDLELPPPMAYIVIETDGCMEGWGGILMGTLDSLKIYYLDKEEVTIRTDCQAIIAFYNKQAQNKPSRIRGGGYNGERKYEGGDYAIPKPIQLTDGTKIHPKEILLTYSPYPALPLHTDAVDKHRSTAHTIKHYELIQLGKTLATVEGMLHTKKRHVAHALLKTTGPAESCNECVNVNALCTSSSQHTLSYRGLTLTYEQQPGPPTAVSINS